MAKYGDSTGRVKQRWSVYHVSVFVITFFSFAFLHTTRKTFSNVKISMSNAWTPTIQNSSLPDVYPNKIWNDHVLFQNADKAEPFLGTLDAVFLVSYAIGLYISGMIGDRFDLRKFLTFGMCSSAIVVFFFGYVSEWLQFYNKAYYIAFWIINGLLQSTGWPTVVAIMGNWFGKSSRGVIFGVWSACASFGNIIGALMTASVLDYGYQYAFLFTSTVLFAGGIVVFFGLVPSPKEVGLAEPDEEVIIDAQDDDAEPLIDEKEIKVINAIGFLQAVLLPGVIAYSLAYACIKLVNYGFYFWLPFYLNNKLHWTEKVADDISIFYDIGGIIGGMVGGFISDRMASRSPVLFIMLILSFPSLYGYSVSPDNKSINAVLMALAGFFLCGVGNLISSAVAADLGKHDNIRGNKAALGTVTGIIDGTGSVGAAIGQFLIPVIHIQLGWESVFYGFLIMTFMALLCLLPLLVKDIQSWQKRRKASRELRIQEDASSFHADSDE